ncbi:MAG: hypothetical protein U0694_02240 [Anaerolineae bacterium]
MIIGGVILLVVVSSALIPPTTPAFDAAVRFVEAAASGEDDAAFALLSPQVQAYVRADCPDGSVSACVRGYTPPEWGSMQSAVFRRAAPDGQNWDVQVIATYQYAQGFSGVCIYVRMESTADGQWQVAQWAGFLSCGDPASRDMATNPDTPNRVP